MFYYNRLRHVYDPRMKKTLRLRYREIELLHSWAMDVFKTLLPAFVAGAELFIIFSMFLVIRMNLALGFLFSAVGISLGINCFVFLKLSLQFSAKVTSSSKAFSTTPYVSRKTHFSKEDRRFLASCRPLALRVGSTFTISRETFPTISQDIILIKLMNLLVVL